MKQKIEMYEGYPGHDYDKEFAATEAYYKRKGRRDKKAGRPRAYDPSVWPEWWIVIAYNKGYDGD